MTDISNVARLSEPLKFAYWVPNVSGGLVVSTIEQRTGWDFDYNKKLARIAENSGFEYALTQTRYAASYGADKQHEATSFSLALLAATERLKVISAVHPGMWHPGVLAKYIITADHISNGRAAVNIVSGWLKDEFTNFGLEWLEHDERYVRTEEFIKVLRGLWTEQDYSQSGKYYNITDFTLNPAPVDVPGRAHPEIFFGGNSTAAQATAGRVADWYFSNGKDLEGFKENIAGVVAAASGAQTGRGTGRLPSPAPRFGLNGFVIARDSEKEARDTLREIVEKAHKPAVEGFRAAVQEAGASTKDGKGMWADSSFEDLVQYNDGFKTQLIGTPEQIAERIVAYKKIGVNLFLTGYLHFQEEVAAFGQDILPIVRELEADLARKNGIELDLSQTPVANVGLPQLVSCVMADRKFGFRTRALHAGGTPDAEHGARAVPIYQTTSFVFKDTQDAANLFALQKYGNIYSRIGNPTVAAFEERIASLEGGIGAVATSSGMAAEFITFAALTQAGDHIVAASQLYGGTVTQLDVTLRRFGVDTTFVPGTDPADYAAAVRENTKAIFVEVVANPSSEVQDLAALAKVAHDAGVPLVVDATLSTPVPRAADRARGGHRDPLRHQVPRRPRHHPRRRDRRKRPLRLGQRQLPHDDRARGLLRQRLLVGELRRVRVPDQAALRTVARHRPGTVPAVGVPAAAGRGNAPPAPRRAPEERPGRGRMARGGRARGLRELLRPALAPALRAGAGSTCRWVRARCSPSASRAAAPRARSSSSPCSWPRTWPMWATPGPWSSTPGPPPTSSSAPNSSSPPVSPRTWSASPWASRTSMTSSGTWTRRWTPRPGRPRSRR